MSDLAHESQPGRAELVFSCKQCGHCCEGKGGIVLKESDIARLAEFLGLPEKVLLGEYAEKAGEKYRLKTAANGFCVFFQSASGCGVHAAKPDVCRAWPFFRGNLVDEISFELAKDYCPGIRKDASFSEFSETGIDWLDSLGLCSEKSIANALRIKGPGGKVRF